MKTTQQTHPKTSLASSIAAANFSGGLEDWFEIFKSGEQTDSAGRTQTFTDADLDSVIANHTAGKEAPFVVGHPKVSDPAYGWTSELKREGDTLFAKGKDVVAEFSDAVKNKHFPKRSVSLANDGKGGFKLRHIGFLGGAAPAVSGLKDIQFSNTSDEITFEFSANDRAIHREVAWGFGSIARMLRGLRERIIASGGIDEADKALPTYQIDSIQSTENSILQSLSKDEPSRFSNADNENPQEYSMSDTPKQTPAELAAIARADAAEKRLKDLEFASKKADVTNFVTSLSKDGQALKPTDAKRISEFMTHLASVDDSTFEFSAADGTEQKTLFEFAKELIGGAIQPVKTGKDKSEGPPEGGAKNYSAPAGYTVNQERAELHQKALDYAAQHNVDYTIAIQQVEKQS